MAMKPCPKCKGLIPVGMAYCSNCAPLVQQELEIIRAENAKAKAKQYNAQRGQKYLKFYRSKDWRLTSKAKLTSVEYKCEARLPGCTGLATETHHIKPIQTPEGWDLRLDWFNLEAVCTSCHNGRHPEKLHYAKLKAEADGVIDLRAQQTWRGTDGSTASS